ncbi:MAG: hypothetical protein LBC03_05580 [Nitrososphaerota archaeon]|jgi:hypothetical protein|nr:hypothetical protein [Nitrososphaerota archaeon]
MMSDSLGLFICYVERNFGRSLSPTEVKGLIHILGLYEQFRLSTSKLDNVVAMEAKL